MRFAHLSAQAADFGGLERISELFALSFFGVISAISSRASIDKF